ncbi:MAG: ABC transporter ATP-binding protein [Pseudomonadota bacterium]
MSLLELEHVSVSYGQSPALFDVNLRLAEGEVLALLGRNGMGKSTTIKCICRMLSAKGSLKFHGKDISRLPSHRVGQMGIGLVPEGRRCFTNLTVEENLIVAARSGYWTFETVSKLFPRLRERKNQSAVSLSGGEQQMLAIGRSLMTNPNLLILDEATEGLAPLIREEIWSAIATLKAETGLAILLIDKALQEMAQVADTAVILQRGKSVWDGKFADLTDDLKNSYIGV